MAKLTKKLYLEDDYKKEFEAEIIDYHTLGYAFDKTAFYPTGGHQANDTGRITLQDGQHFDVLDVTEQDGIIYHKIKAGTKLPVGEKITGKLFWPRRYYHMRLHTAQHQISQVVEELFGPNQTVRSNFDWDSKKGGLVKLEHPLSVKEWKKVEQEVQQRIRQDLPVTRTAHEKSKQMTIYHVLIDDEHPNACGGTHVHHLSEIGEMAFVSIHGDKLYYEIEPRLQHKIQTILWTYHGIMASIPDHKHDQAVQYVKKLKQHEADLSMYTETLNAELMTSRLLQAQADQKIVTGTAFMFVDLSFMKLKEIRDTLLHEYELENSVYVILGDKGSCCVISSDPDRFSARKLFGHIKKAFKIHGGGSDEFAQGGPLPEDQENLLAKTKQIVLQHL